MPVPSAFLPLFALFVAIFLSNRWSLVFCQFSPQLYPDPRIDPLSCRMLLPGQVCDPAEILTPDERRVLNEKILRLQQITANIRNSAPACADPSVSRNTNLFIMIALVERLGPLSLGGGGGDNAVNIEKFTNQLRSKYQNYQDISLCDPLVLVVNSRGDRQVFTVAGRDARLSREVLQSAFQRNVGHFRGGNYALGLEGMVEYIVSAYGSAHIVQVPPPPGELNFVPTSISVPTSSGTGQFVAHGVRQQQHQRPLARLDLDAVPETDRLWVRLLAKAVAQCGNDPDRLVRHVRAVVEDAMDISLKLISDAHYNRIEEDAQNSEKANARDKAWQAVGPLLEELYTRYGGGGQLQRVEQCPAEPPQQQQERHLRIVRLT